MPTHIQIGDVSPRVQLTADGVQTQFTFLFPIFEDADLEVYLDTVKQSSGFTVFGAGNSVGGSISFDGAPNNGVTVTLARRLAVHRTSDFQESGEFRSKVINDELDYLTASLQQVADDQSRSAQVSVTQSVAVDMNLPSPVVNAALVWNGSADGFANGPSVDDIANAQTYANTAALSATSAASSASTAQSSVILAQSAASAAQTAVSSNMYATNESKSADFTIAVGDDGKQFLIDTSTGPITVTLPEGSTASDGFRFAMGKVSADNNGIVLVCGGTDLINGSASWQFSAPYAQSVITLDTTPAPDTWFAAGVGVPAPVGVADLHDNAKPYDIAFVAGFDATMVAEDMAVQTYGEMVVPRGLTVMSETLLATIAPSGLAMVFDIEKNGTSIYATKPQVAAGVTTAMAGVFASSDISAGDRLTFKCTQIGSTVAGGGVLFTLAGKLT